MQWRGLLELIPFVRTKRVFGWARPPSSKHDSRYYLYLQQLMASLSSHCIYTGGADKSLKRYSTGVGRSMAKIFFYSPPPFPKYFPATHPLSQNIFLQHTPFPRIFFYSTPPLPKYFSTAHPLSQNIFLQHTPFPKIFFYSTPPFLGTPIGTPLYPNVGSYTTVFYLRLEEIMLPDLIILLCLLKV